MTPRAAHRAAPPGMPLPSDQRRSLPWSDEDIAKAAFRARAVGASEHEFVVYLEVLVERGVRNVWRYVRGIEDERLLGEIRSRYAHPYAGRRDQYGGYVRALRRWPWRTSTTEGGGVGV